MKDVIPKEKKRPTKKSVNPPAGFTPERGSGKTTVFPVEENRTPTARRRTLETERFLRRRETTTDKPEEKKTKQKSAPVQISWQAPEYAYRQKSTDWFWLVAVSALVLFIVSIFFLNNFLFGILILLMGFVMLLYGAKKPRDISFAISPRGITIGKNLYLYDDIKSFWIHYNPPAKKEISLKSRRTFVSHITMPLGNINPNLARTCLLKYIKEERHEESFSDMLEKYF